MHADDRQQDQEKDKVIVLDAGFNFVAENVRRREYP